MARSSYCYVVRDEEYHLMGAFTVKHEVMSELARYFRRYPNASVTVTRCRDGVLDPGAETKLVAAQVPQGDG